MVSDDEAKLGRLQDPAPRWLGNVLAWLLPKLPGMPAGLEFAKCAAEGLGALHAHCTE